MSALVFGSALVVGFSANALLRYKGVKISPEHKRADMPLPSESATAHSKTITEVLAAKQRGPTSFHARKYTSLPHEGLGIDHEEWKAAKMASQRSN